MSVKEILTTLRKRWRLITVFAVAGLLGSSALVLSATPKYSASVQLFFAQRVPTAAYTNTFDNYAATIASLPSYVDLANKEPVLQPVIDKVDLPYSWQHLASEVHASTSSQTKLLDISVLDPSATRARDIANAVGSQLADYVTKLETVAPGPSAIRATVTQPATLPSAPATPQVARYIVAGLLLGLAIGIAGAFLREGLDTTVNGTEGLTEELGLTGLGAIPYDPDTPAHPLAIGRESKVHRGEAFGQLRTNLQFIQVDSRPRSILVTSSVASEGKTTTVANVAISLAQVGASVIAVEGDLRRPRLCGYLGLDNAVGLTSVLLGWAELDEVLQPWGPDGTNLRVLGSGPLPPNPSELLASEQMRRLLAELEDTADVLVIDGPPLLPVADSAVLAAHTSGTIMVVRQGKTKREQVRRALDALAAVDARILGAVLNMVPHRRGGDYTYTYDYVSVPAARRLAPSANGMVDDPAHVVQRVAEGARES